jgi:nucleotide-binding universal stress UspA family protein
MQPEFTDGSELYEALEQRAKDVAEETAGQAQREDGTGVVVETQVVLAAPSAALVTAGKEAALLVVGSHGRHGIGRFLLGSVSHDVILGAQCPVLVLRVTDKAA